MVFFFSGTGNSRFAAGRLSEALGEDLRFIPETHPEHTVFSGRHLGFVFPVYSWGVPPLVLDFIASLPEAYFEDAKRCAAKVWMVCTCGDETALSPEMLARALESRGVRLEGAWSVIMPNNYVILPGFNTDPKDVEERKLREAPARIDSIAAEIARGEMKTDVTVGSLARLKSRLVYPLFRRFGIFPSKWRWNDACLRCERCSLVCPTRNVRIVGGHPVWGKRCVSCLACYHNCPVHSVEYGNATHFKGQYVCPLK